MAAVVEGTGLRTGAHKILARLLKVRAVDMPLKDRLQRDNDIVS